MFKSRYPQRLTTRNSFAKNDNPLRRPIVVDQSHAAVNLVEEDINSSPRSLLSNLFLCLSNEVRYLVGLSLATQAA